MPETRPPVVELDEPCQTAPWMVCHIPARCVDGCDRPIGTDVGRGHAEGCRVVYGDPCSCGAFA